MFLTFFLSGLRSAERHKARFTWSPSLDLRDTQIFSALIPGGQY